MSRPYHRCQQCGRDDGEAGRISKRGLCADCGEANYRMNAEAMRNKSGPGYAHYAKKQADGMLAYAQKQLAIIDERIKT